MWISKRLFNTFSINFVLLNEYLYCTPEKQANKSTNHIQVGKQNKHLPPNIRNLLFLWIPVNLTKTRFTQNDQCQCIFDEWKKLTSQDGVAGIGKTFYNNANTKFREIRNKISLANGVARARTFARPPGGPNWGRTRGKFEEKWEKIIQDWGKMRKCSSLAHLRLRVWLHPCQLQPSRRKKYVVPHKLKHGFCLFVCLFVCLFFSLSKQLENILLLHLCYPYDAVPTPMPTFFIDVLLGLSLEVLKIFSYGLKWKHRRYVIIGRPYFKLTYINLN